MNDRPTQKLQRGIFSTEEVVTALYRAVFDRLPDTEGLERHSQALRHENISLSDLASAFNHSEEHQTSIASGACLRDYTQFGELKELLNILLHRGSKHQIVVDVGARGRDRSNSFNLLRDFGWRGLLIEANPALIANIREEFAGLKFDLLNCGVSDETGRMPFYLGANDDVSSLLSDHAQTWGDLRGSVEVDVERLGNILLAHNIPEDLDLLSLDIEGLDVRVFNDLIETTNYRPEIVIIEASHDFKTKALADVGFGAMAQAYYKLSAQTRANLILTTK